MVFLGAGGGEKTPNGEADLTTEWPHQNNWIFCRLWATVSADYSSSDHSRGDPWRFRVPRGSLTTTTRKLRPVYWLTDFSPTRCGALRWSDRPARRSTRRWFNWSQPATEFRDCIRTCQSSSRTRSYSHALALGWDTVRKVRSGQPDAVCRP